MIENTHVYEGLKIFCYVVSHLTMAYPKAWSNFGIINLRSFGLAADAQPVTPDNLCDFLY
jgi:hypothetical protein